MDVIGIDVELSNRDNEKQPQFELGSFWFQVESPLRNSPSWITEETHITLLKTYPCTNAKAGAGKSRTAKQHPLGKWPTIIY